MSTTPGRRLVLLRHAKSAWPEGVPDWDRPLGKRGRRDAPGAGRWLRDAGCVPGLVLVSPARRARETWELAAAELAEPPRVRVEQRVSQATAADLLELAREAPAATAALLIVGHDPAIQGLAVSLAGDGRAGPGQPGAAERMRAKFPTAAIAVLEFTGKWRALGPGRARLAHFSTARERAA